MLNTEQRALGETDQVWASLKTFVMGLSPAVRGALVGRLRAVDMSVHLAPRAVEIGAERPERPPVTCAPKSRQQRRADARAALKRR